VSLCYLLCFVPTLCFVPFPRVCHISSFFFFTHPAPTDIYTLSLHDALPIFEITREDIDTIKHTHSRLSVGSKLSRRDLLLLALMSSENRAASALGRNYPGGLPAFVRAMNEKAHALGMRYTLFVEPTGLSSENLST